MDSDPDPGGLKTCGSGGSGFGSGTMVKRVKRIQTSCYCSDLVQGFGSRRLTADPMYTGMPLSQLLQLVQQHQDQEDPAKPEKKPSDPEPSKL